MSRPKRINRLAFILSLLVNLTAMWLLMDHSKKPPPPEDQPLQMVDINDGVSDISPSDPNSKKEPCQTTYVGIGILLGYKFRVDKAPPGLPAYDGGIREGDFFESYGLPMTRGVPIRVSVLREGIRLYFTITPTDVCFSE